MTNTDRPFFQHSIAELEALFDERSIEPAFVDAMIAELAHRQTHRANRLAERARAARAGSQSDALGNVPRAPSAPGSRATGEGAGPLLEPVEAPMPPIADRPADVLSAWTALEVLSPQMFGRPHELASNRDRTLVAEFSHGLPWEVGDHGRQNRRLFYHVVLGTLDAPRAFQALLERYIDRRSEQPRVKAEAVLASVIVDKNGVPVPEDAVVISSFAWGLPVALHQDLVLLSRWSSVLAGLHAGLAKQLRAYDSAGNERPLDRARIDSAYRWLLSELNLPREYSHPPKFAIRVFQDYRFRDPPDALLLNSFFLGDLARAQDHFTRGTAPKALRLYLGQDEPTSRRDLLDDVDALEEAIAPSITPRARWPSLGRHPLVLLQQAAVNLAMKDKEPGILAVNGPPGTGKTTLLRDLVAALVSQRADAMCHFEDPARAFSDSGQRIKLGQEAVTLYTMDPSLKGFEILVASSNNGAVENVSAELPARSAIASDAGLSYFKALSDALIERDTWGLIAGVLGNAANRSRFAKTFWWDHDLGFATYLAEAAGTPQWIDVEGPNNTRARRRPRLVVEASAPSSHAEALRRWTDVREQFRQRSDEARRLLEGLEAIRAALKSFSALTLASAAKRAARDLAASYADQLKERFHEALRQETRAKHGASAAEELLRAHETTRPGLLARMLRTQLARDWTSKHEPLFTSYQNAAKTRVEKSAAAARLEAEWKAALSDEQRTSKEAEAAEQTRAASRRTLDEGAARLGDRLVNAAYFARSHETKHVSVPWCDEIAHRVRDDLFVAAMNLHKAFVDAAAKPLRANLAGWVKAIGPTGSSAFIGRKAPLLIESWASLFLVVPVVSTTFASVERMLGTLPSEALGWLLVDEAGQTVPQAAVGAILRSRRAVVVGDPMQIEPVVALPEKLTQTICRRFGVEPMRFSAPEASAQTLADAATPYMAEFLGRQGSRTVGVPLLVHRRCAEPMFGIANAIAYQRLMVQAKQARHSPIRDCLGPSRWIDVQATSGSRDKWCPEEGEVVIGLLEKLAAAGVSPNLYIISPFRIVADTLKQLLLSQGVLTSWVTDPKRWVGEHVGTVHTVQGREAEAVVIVLGAPEVEQRGARSWAGHQPNLLNVALTRAQEAAYVVGNRSRWQDAGVFGVLHADLPAARS